jgi:hypothetical protein
MIEKDTKCAAIFLDGVRKPTKILEDYVARSGRDSKLTASNSRQKLV